MCKTSLRNVVLVVASSVLGCAAGGCGADWTSGAALRGLLDLSPQPADSTATQEATQADQGDSSAGQDTAASEASQLLQELETVLDGQNTGAAGDGLNSLLAALANVAGSALNSATSQPATSQPATLAHPFRQLRAEIHTLRHSMTREQAAQLLLSALAAANTTDGSVTTGAGSSGFDLLTQVQSLLATLRAVNTQSTTP